MIYDKLSSANLNTWIATWNDVNPKLYSEKKLEYAVNTHFL